LIFNLKNITLKHLVINKLSNYQIIKLSNYQIIKLSNYQIIFINKCLFINKIHLHCRLINSGKCFLIKSTQIKLRLFYSKYSCSCCLQWRCILSVSIVQRWFHFKQYARTFYTVLLAVNLDF
jgi:hypothetical protein